jgi:ABC-type sugar transport system ATPase subunit
VADAVTGLREVTKRFGSIVALDGVTIDIAGGSVHALVGENGAGKSTVVNILSGVLQPDEGSVTLDGAPTAFVAPSAAMRAGISTIYQERAIVSKMTVGENIVLGHESTRFGLIQRKKSDRIARTFLSRVQLAVDPRRPMASLPPAEQQLVAIAKALSHRVRVLILDEPTAALTATEAEKLFSLLAELRAKGIAVLYITHRMREVARLADAVTVLKDGRLVRTIEAAGVTEEQILPLMVGREIDRLFPPLEPPRDEVALEAHGLEVPGELQQVSLRVRAGEIVGIAGLEGSGKSALARVLAGSETPAGGWIEVHGSRMKGHGVVESLRSGVGYVPPDRRAQATIRTFSIKASTTLAALPQISRLGFLRMHAERELAGRITQRLGVKAPSIEAPIWTLSGGNQQKIVLGRMLAVEVSVLVCDEPTAGVDVGARAEIYRYLAEAAAQGNAIVLVSSDVLELIGLCHRTVVLCEGCVVADFPHGTVSEEELVRTQLPRYGGVMAHSTV